MSIGKEIEQWFDYNFLPSKRWIYIGSHTAETSSGEGESGTDCQMAEFFIKAILQCNAISNSPIIVHMDNIGGDWYAGMAMYDAIRASRAHVYGVCWGHAMSMGSVIIQACDSRIATTNCIFMIHDGSGDCAGSCKDVEAWTRHNTDLRRQMYRIYHQRMRMTIPSITLKQIEGMCSHDTILSSKQALQYGLIDWILDNMDDPYNYCATKSQKSKWRPGLKTGKHKIKCQKEEEEDS